MHICIQVTTICNRRCSYCETDKTNPVSMSFKQIKNIISVCSEKTSIEIIGGEPFCWHDHENDFNDLLKYCNNIFSSITVWTNASRKLFEYDNVKYWVTCHDYNFVPTLKRLSHISSDKFNFFYMVDDLKKINILHSLYKLNKIHGNITFMIPYQLKHELLQHLPRKFFTFFENYNTIMDKTYLCAGVPCPMGFKEIFIDVHGNIHRCMSSQVQKRKNQILGNVFLDGLKSLSVPKMCDADVCLF